MHSRAKNEQFHGKTRIFVGLNQKNCMGRTFPSIEKVLQGQRHSRKVFELAFGMFVHANNEISETEGILVRKMSNSHGKTWDFSRIMLKIA